MERRTIDGKRMRFYCACDYPEKDSRAVWNEAKKKGCRIGFGIACEKCQLYKWTFTNAWKAG